MKQLILLLPFVLPACAMSSLSPENKSGLEVSIEKVRDHGDGLDVAIALTNNSNQTMRVFNKGSALLVFDSSTRIKGSLSETLELAPGERKGGNLKFAFINVQGLYRKAVIELKPFKVFRTCKIADQDPEVEKDNKRTPATDDHSDIEPDSCDRALKRPIRIGF